MSEAAVLRTLTADDLRPLIGTTVAVRADGQEAGPVDMVVHSIDECPGATMPKAPRTAFSVALTASADVALPSFLWAILARPDGGAIGPVSMQRVVAGEVTEAPTAWYEVVFN